MSIPAECGSGSPSSKAISVNVQGTRHALDLVEQLVARSTGAKPKFVFASTVHVYADVRKSSPFVTENAPIEPTSAYGQTKLRGELEILHRIKQSGLRACIARGFHHIGPRQPEGLMLTDWLTQLNEPNCTELKVRSTNSRLDLIDVRDAAQGYKLLAEVSGAQGIYNLGSGKISKSGDVLDRLLELLDRRVTVIEAWSAEKWNAIADIRKIKALGWEATTSYGETIASMIGPHVD